MTSDFRRRIRGSIAAGAVGLAFIGCGSSEQSPVQPSTGTGQPPTPSPVVPVVPVASVVVFSGSNGLRYGSSQKVYAYAVDANGQLIANRKIAWLSSNAAIASLQPEDDSLRLGRVGAPVATGAATVTSLAGGRDTISASVDGHVGQIVLDFSSDVSAVLSMSDQPAALPIADNAIPLTVSVSSLFAIANVVATVNGTQTRFTPAAGGKWSGDVPLSSVPFGPNPVQISVTDIRGVSTTIRAALGHYSVPQVTVTSPAAAAVVTGTSLRITAQCSVPDGTSCTSLVVGIHDATGNVLASASHFATGTVGSAAPIDTVVELKPTSDLLLYAAVSANAVLPTQFRRNFYLSGSPAITHFSLLAATQGTVLDYRNQRVLYVDSSNASAPTLRLRVEGEGDVTIDQGNAIGPAVLTANGAIYVGSSAGSQHLYHYDGKTRVDLGAVKAAALNPAFAAFLDNSNVLFVRDLAVGKTRTVSSEPNISTDFDVSETGAVAFSVGNSNGKPKIKTATIGDSAAPITKSDSLGEVQPKWSGSMLAYLGCTCSLQFRGNMFIVTVHTPTGELQLSSLGGLSTPFGALTFTTNSGWIAYTTPDKGGVFQPRSYSPTGVDRPVSPILSQPAVVEAVGTGGEVVFTAGGKRFVAAPPYSSLTSVGSQGVVGWRDGGLVAFVGGAVYRITY